MQLFIMFLIIAGIVVAGLVYVSNRFGGDTAELKKQLTAERERSMLAQNALRQIATGDEMPVLRASDALNQINQTYTKEIS